jgi:O-antigen/teichoic acid export membrane protein
MRQSTRLIINALATFGRMALNIVAGLLATRLLLQYLGKVDFGLLLALGATGAMLQFITGALTSGAQRQLAYEIASDSFDRLRSVFSTAWAVFMGLGILMWVVGIALTPAIMHGLTIPAERANAAWWVYQITLFNLLVAVSATPFRALIVAHQQLTINAVADAIMAISQLIGVLILTLVSWDWMVTYSAFQLLSFAVVCSAIIGYCLWKYPESRPSFRQFNNGQLKEITRIATWTLLNQLSVRFRNQGGILLLNVYYGPAVNAAYGIAVRISDYALNVSQALQLTVLPAIVGAHAKGHHKNVHRLALVAGKYTVLLSSLLFVPIWLEAPTVILIWLGEVPEYTPIFARLIILWTFIYVFGVGYQLALFATGNVGWYARQNFLVSALTLLVAAAGFYFGLPPWFLPATTVLAMSWMTLIGVWWVGKEIELPVSRWVHESLLPTLGVLLPAVATAAFVRLNMHEDIWRVLAVTVTYGLVATPLIWWVGLASWERQHFLSFAASALARLQRTN